MGNLVKILTGILGVLAVVACLATVGVVGYVFVGGGSESSLSADEAEEAQAQPTAAAVPTSTPGDLNGADEEIVSQPVSLDSHVHNYVESVEQKATCYQAGSLKYTCDICGDFYYVDVHSTGHVADDEWEIVTEATKDQDGVRVKRCIYCDTIVAQETFSYAGSSSDSQEEHIHDYIATIEREPTCVLAGLRKYTCSCGSFYTESIPASGHVATDWTVVEEATATKLGREQRTCTVCGVVLDSRPITTVSSSASPSAAATASSSSSSASASASASATPTTTPHVHEYVSYVLKEANCTEKGIRSFVCSCGSSYAESIDLDLNNHDYVATVIPATTTSPGYTLYRCRRCNATYMDNYTQVLSSE